MAMKHFTLLPLLTSLLLQGTFAQTSRAGNVPGEIADSAGEWISGLPLPCTQGCLIPARTYYVCYLQPIAANGEIANQDECNEYLCNQETYNQLLACLNCIVANGDERPRGYHTNSALTAPASDDALGPAATPIGGYLDADQGNGWLANVTERCGSVGRSLNNLTTTLTATPTTTGPYQTSWTSGQTIDLGVWTGLTEYSESFTPSVTPVWGGEDAGSQSGTVVRSLSSGSSASIPTSNAVSSTSSAPVEATSRPNGAGKGWASGKFSVCMGFVIAIASSLVASV